ncbi:MAG: response regulator [Bacteroidota bacterium]
MKILIIDDSVFFREKLKEAIKSLDITILILEELTFESGKRAFAYHNPDLVILEIEIQGKSGIKLLQEIKSSSLSCMVIIFTNYSSEEFKANCLENGADYFFDKSKTYVELLEIIRSQANI